MMIILDIVIGLIGLGVVIFVHESGHFIAAKLSGITVEAFSIGWGKKLASFTRNGTEYRISMLPIGGYCKMKGEEFLRKAIENSDDKIEASEGSLFSVSPFKRLLTYLAGPVANLVFAAVVMAFVWLVGFSFQSVGNKIVLLTDYPKLATQSSYPANAAGLESGDRIVAVDGNPVRNFQDLEQQVAPYPNQVLTLTIDRQGKTKTLKVTPQLDKSSGAGVIGVSAWVEPVVASVKGGSGAYIAGLKPGDRLLSANGTKIANTMDFAELMKNQPGKLAITYERDGKVGSTTLIPTYSSGTSSGVGLSFRIETFHSPRVGFFGAIGKGLQETGNT
ncbi:MAG TPA: site-2 protease family protein, partial [Spirochaetia bacterium]|nr:site-2 protease family protein [Spirochaetia bacterium]